MIPPSKEIETLGNHSLTKIDTAVASLDIAKTIPVQYTHPTTNPTPSPKILAAKVLNEPESGFATVISDIANNIK
ncbi:hypothetical protein D3C73_1283490 [compost metagenome]